MKGTRCQLRQFVASAVRHQSARRPRRQVRVGPRSPFRSVSCLTVNARRGRDAVRGAEFRSPEAPDTPETQESTMECVCEHSQRHRVEHGRERANPSAGVCECASTSVQVRRSGEEGVSPPVPASPWLRWGSCPPHTCSVFRGAWGPPRGAARGPRVVCLHLARG